MKQDSDRVNRKTGLFHTEKGEMMKRTEMRNPNTMHIDKMTSLEMCKAINRENMVSVQAIDYAIEEVAKAVDMAAEAIQAGGRIIYVGAGTSGRLGSQDAAECPPTYGVPFGTVICLMAGGERALTHASENQEDSAEMGRKDVLAVNVCEKDFVLGISASGDANYVIAALEAANEVGAKTASLSSNPGTGIGRTASLEIFVDSGEEAITGSTRMKAGNVQKMVLNMISTGAMVKSGFVYENLMVNVKPSNVKLEDRCIRIVRDIKGCSYEEAEKLFHENDSNIRKAIEA